MAAKQQLVPVDRLLGILNEYGTRALKDVKGQGMLRLVGVLEKLSVELAPLDTGRLAGSTSVTVEEKGTQVVGTLSFNTEYASEVHELPTDRRGPETKKKPGNFLGDAGPKYVERPLKHFTQALSKDMGAFLQQVWAKSARRAKPAPTKGK